MASVTLVCAYCSWLFVALRPKQAIHYSHLILIGGTVATAFVVLATRGVSAAFAMLYFSAILLTVLFSSARTSIIAWSVLLLGTAVTGVLASYGWNTFITTGPEVDVATWPIRVTVIATLTACLATAIYLMLRELEQSLARSKALLAELQKSSAARAAEVEARRQAEQHLWRAQRLDAVGQIAAGFAHDVNNNLTVLRGTMELLRSGADISGLLNEVEYAIDSASSATRQMLSLGRRDVYKMESVQADQELESVAKVLRRALPPAITLSVDTREACVVFAVDRQQFRQALLNLVVNARDAIEAEGQINIRASLQPVANTERAEGAAGEAEKRLVIEVRDDGPGIDPAIMPHVFEPFYTTKSESRGSGLGLAHVESFMHRAGGQIEIEAGTKQGTCVRLRFPVTPGERVAPKKATVAAAATLEGVRVLIVDDDQSVLTTLKMLYDQLGAHTVTAETADQALAKATATSEPFDLLCTDALMPVMGGAELAVKFAEKHPEVAVLVCSGYVDAASLRSSLENLRYGFLRKPFTSEQLATASLAAMQSKQAVNP